MDHGSVICFSIYGGADLHFGAEKNPKQNLNQIWVDTYFDGNVSLSFKVVGFLDLMSII